VAKRLSAQGRPTATSGHQAPLADPERPVRGFRSVAGVRLGADRRTGIWGRHRDLPGLRRDGAAHRLYRGLASDSQDPRLPEDERRNSRTPPVTRKLGVARAGAVALTGFPTMTSRLKYRQRGQSGGWTTLLVALKHRAATTRVRGIRAWSEAPRCVYDPTGGRPTEPEQLESDSRHSKRRLFFFTRFGRSCFGHWFLRCIHVAGSDVSV